jgi:DNA mismatch repair protein MutL
LKFLKSPPAEVAAVARIVEQCALANPGVHFVFTVDGEERLNAPPSTDALSRVRAAIGAPDIRLLPFDGSGGGVAVHGLAEEPGTVSRRGRQWILVNRRPVEDRAIRHALIAGYSGQLPRDTQPYAVVFVELAPEMLDVNVHPAKAEVRFVNPSQVYRTINGALRGAFGMRTGGTTAAGGAEPVLAPRVVSLAAPDTSAASAAEPLLPWAAQAASTTAGGLEVICQLFQTYIVARDREGLILVDQHTAHEKVIYEHLQSRKGNAEMQGLLITQTVELSPSEFALVIEHSEAIQRIGVEFEPFGGRSIVIRSVPPEARDRDLAPLLRWLLEDLEQAGRLPSASELSKRLLATMSCHLAVRAGDKLDRAAMERIVHELHALADPGTCPHGRPTYIRHDEAELSRLFRRTWGLGKRECH